MLGLCQQRNHTHVVWCVIQEAELQRREQAAKSKQFSLGKLAYGKGLYPESARLFEVALDKEGPFSKLGGEIQLWQALAYQVKLFKNAAKQALNRAILAVQA